MVYAQNRPLGPPHSQHQIIAALGKGRFSHWHNTLYFSATDNSNPRRNGRKYSVKFSVVIRPVFAIAALVALILTVLLNSNEIKAIGTRIHRRVLLIPIVGWTYVNVLPGAAISMGVIGLIAVGAEVYFRNSVPFQGRIWPNEYHPKFGSRFRPGHIVKATNSTDFWTITKANSLGFLDREPPTDRPPNTCRVVFIGDSYVEASQVPIDKKFHVIFQDRVNARFPNRNFQSVAFGYSGTGQVNQLPYYDFFAKPLQPDVVVLVIVNNDFANNSHVLESVRNGWHPLHAPRPFFRLNRPTGEITPLPIDREWEAHMLPARPRMGPPAPSRPFHNWLVGNSLFYKWVYRHLSVQYPWLYSRVSVRGKGARPQIGRKAHRMNEISKINGFADVFEGWNIPNDLSYDDIFFARQLPPVFEEALTITAYALDEYLSRAGTDGFRLLALSAYGLSRSYPPGKKQFGRDMVDRGYFKRLQKLLKPRGIPLIDQYDWIVAQGGKVKDARFQRDGHWSSQGHIWAAEALLEYFQRNPQVCGK